MSFQAWHRRGNPWKGPLSIDTNVERGRNYFSLKFCRAESKAREAKAFSIRRPVNERFVVLHNAVRFGTWDLSIGTFIFLLKFIKFITQLLILRHTKSRARFTDFSISSLRRFRSFRRSKRHKKIEAQRLNNSRAFFDQSWALRVQRTLLCKSRQVMK